MWTPEGGITKEKVISETLFARCPCETGTEGLNLLTPLKYLPPLGIHLSFLYPALNSSRFESQEAKSQVAGSRIYTQRKMDN